ncbi:hypothetical protein O181_062669 [Austropuccinia psidii MF-1]|uniref:Uncharacterized protein n=1 Tax=Austropuccinia psidii MF-1 TaxID=1389203 RepID=A0A9Q3I1S5_9BASI|nr:hypothetical protein [Austropuccinia psidii MF-1]
MPYISRFQQLNLHKSFLTTEKDTQRQSITHTMAWTPQRRREVPWIGGYPTNRQNHGITATSGGASFLMAHSCRPFPTPRDHFSVSISSKRAIKLMNAKMTQPASNAQGTTCPKTARTQLKCHLSRDVYNALTKI